MTKGIDISHHNSNDPGQSPIDWQKVAATTAPDTPIQFAIIKASEGKTNQDQAARANALGASNAGILIAYYHFARPGSNAAADEAKNFYDTLTAIGVPPTFTYPYALDLEVNSGLDKNDFLAWVENFMSAFLGNFPGTSYPDILIYGSPDFLKTNLPPDHTLGTRFKLWIANPAVAAPAMPPGWADWTLWQFLWNDQINGIVGNVDSDWAKLP